MMDDIDCNSYLPTAGDRDGVVYGSARLWTGGKKETGQSLLTAVTALTRTPRPCDQ